MNYAIHVLVTFEIYLILSLAMNYLAGYSGMLSMTQAALYGIGAYVTAILMLDLSAPFLVAVVIAVIFNLIASVPIIWFAARLRNLFFAMATLSWQMIVFHVLQNWISLTNGPFGISGIPKPEMFGIQFAKLADFALVSGLFAIVVLAFYVGLNYTPLSRLHRGMRDDELAVMSYGKNPTHLKSIAILIASATTAIAGALYATYYSYIDPTSFSIHESILILSMVLIGGLGSVRGSIAGALFYVSLPELLRFMDLPDAAAANLRIIIFALALVLVVKYRPFGFFGTYKFD